MQTARPNVLVTIASLLLMTLAGCAAVGEDIEVEAPAWRSGYAWSYAYNETWDYVDIEDGARDNYTESEDGRFIRQVVNTSQVAGTKPVYVMIEQDTARDSGRLRVKAQADLGRVAYGYGYSNSCTNGACTGSLDIDFERGEDDPIMPPYLDFPLFTGKSWGDIIDLSEDEDIPFSISVGAAVAGAAIVDLPCGPVKAAKINMITRPTNLADFEAALIAEAESEGYHVDVLDVAMEERETVYFSADYQAIVKRVVTEAESWYVRGTDPDGEPFEYASEGDYQYTEVLDGARLLPVPEVPLDDLVPYLNGKVKLVDPDCLDIVDAGYVIGLASPSQIINAGAGENATYTVTFDGVDALPEGHTLHWQLRDREGRLVDTAIGKTFKAGVPGPGRYTVAVEARQGTSLVSGDSGSLTANWITSSILDCPAVTAFGVPACDRGVIPMSPGIKSLLVRAVPVGPLGALPGSSMVVEDSAGQPISGSADGDGYKVEITDFTPYLNDGGDWMLQFRHSAGVASAVEMQITAIYGGDGLRPVAEPEAGRMAALRGAERLPW